SLPLFYIILLFFFPPSLHLRDLHSFPTRRSSDLNDRQGKIIASSRTAFRHFPHRQSTPRGRLNLADSLLDSGDHPLLRPAPIPRSEEHTSELQSLAYLVCRLLLEKKKTKTIQIIY